jgi:hypothetical protein
MTKQDVIDLLDELEPGVDYSGLKGKSLPHRGQEEIPHRPAQEQSATHRGTAEGRQRGTGRESQAGRSTGSGGEGKSEGSLTAQISRARSASDEFDCYTPP